MTEPKSDIVVIVHRVTLPRYEMQYPQVKVAWEHAQSIKERNTFAVPVDFIEPVGQELVFDLGAKGVSLTVTLLFRIIQKTDNTPFQRDGLGNRLVFISCTVYGFQVETFQYISSPPSELGVV